MKLPSAISSKYLEGGSGCTLEISYPLDIWPRRRGGLGGGGGAAAMACGGCLPDGRAGAVSQVMHYGKEGCIHVDGHRGVEIVC